MIRNLRPGYGYNGLYRAVLIIPATENPDVVPCDSTPLADGSHAFSLGIIYLTPVRE